MALPDENPAAFDARVETLTQAVEASSDADARRAARELVDLVLQFHAVALRRLLDAAGSDERVRRRIAGDPVIASVLALHDLQFPEGAESPDSRSTASPLLVRRRSDAGPASVAPHVDASSRCDRCDAPLGQSHNHCVDIASRRLSCRCRACWLLAAAHTAAGTLRAVPDRYVSGPGLRLTAAEWDALQLPVGLVFLMVNSTVGRTIAFYPGPAGATESALPIPAWREIGRSNPWVRDAAPDVEAILIQKSARDDASDAAFIVPIDACYDLVGRIRIHWAGFDGGQAVRAEIERFFADVAARSLPLVASTAGRKR